MPLKESSSPGTRSLSWAGNALTVSERPTEPFRYESEADDCCGDEVEGGEDVEPSFIADEEASELGEPGEGSFDHPSVPAEAFAALDAAASNARDNVPSPRRPAASIEVIPLVCMEPGRSPSWPSSTL